MNNNNEDFENNIKNNSDKNDTLPLTDLFKHPLSPPLLSYKAPHSVTD